MLNNGLKTPAEEHCLQKGQVKAKIYIFLKINMDEHLSSINSIYLLYYKGIHFYISPIHTQNFK